MKMGFKGLLGFFYAYYQLGRENRINHQPNYDWDHIHDSTRKEEDLIEVKKLIKM